MIKRFSNRIARLTKIVVSNKNLPKKKYEEEIIEEDFNKDDIMTATGHDESRGIFLDKMVIYN